ncbi:MAG TPA: hypothetical protein VFK05_32820 [Polyangiaceae bacterium]|nr:hypothetical protein [Polyangiaceae bacterium]
MMRLTTIAVTAVLGLAAVACGSHKPANDPSNTSSTGDGTSSDSTPTGNGTMDNTGSGPSDSVPPNNGMGPSGSGSPGSSSGSTGTGSGSTGTGSGSGH